MKPPQEISENEKSFDGVCLESFSEIYNVLFITKCFLLRAFERKVKIFFGECFNAQM